MKTPAIPLLLLFAPTIRGDIQSLCRSLENGTSDNYFASSLWLPGSRRCIVRSGQTAAQSTAQQRCEAVAGTNGARGRLFRLNPEPWDEWQLIKSTYILTMVLLSLLSQAGAPNSWFEGYMWIGARYKHALRSSQLCEHCFTTGQE